MSNDIDSVRVAIRIRPLVASERERGCQECIERVAGRPQIIVSSNDSYTFNYVFDTKDSQEHLYDQCIIEMIDRLFAGFNATIIAYGQTGSGKTYTMGTAFDGNLDDAVGVIPRAMNDVFQRIKQLSSECEFLVKCSFMELYQEQLFDLLSTQSREQSIVELREDKNGILVQGLTEEIVHTAQETTDCLMRGSNRRAVASTAMNQHSSRSHAIFTLTLRATKQDKMKTVICSKFHLVDLAGSERSKKTQATGDRFKEGVAINQGLLALGNVISALGSNHGTGFVRYRESKLTRLLQDSLGGNSVTLMIACVSPADYNLSETLCTLRYADRARQIKNKPIVNMDPHAAEIKYLKGIIDKLRAQLLAAGIELNDSLNEEEMNILGELPPTNNNANINSNSINTTKQVQEWEEKYYQLQKQLQATLNDVTENLMRAHIVEIAQDQLKSQTDCIKENVKELVDNFDIENVNTEKLKNYYENIQNIYKLLENLGAEFDKAQIEINENKRQCTTNTTNDDKHTPEMQKETQLYTDKVIDFKNQLTKLEQELNLKEELQQLASQNLNRFHSLEDSAREKYLASEEKIKGLEAEKIELSDKLKHAQNNKSAKLAEERRKRLQMLEEQITEMKKRNLQQAKLLQLREKETQKISNLCDEIKEMKAAKVKLLRLMRQESENFRQWKQTREKELLQLKNKDRKLQNEMARKEALHTKQKNVWKRKNEEIIAVNKRLKDALDRQKMQQSQRPKSSSKTATKNEDLISTVDNEVAVITTLTDAEKNLEQLKESAAQINARISEIKKSSTNNSVEAKKLLITLNDELSLCNAQINDLQQKISTGPNTETRVKKLCESVQNVDDARIIMKTLFKNITNLKVDHLNDLHDKNAAIEEEREHFEKDLLELKQLNTQLENRELTRINDFKELNANYEQNVAILLRELDNGKPNDNNQHLTPSRMTKTHVKEDSSCSVEALQKQLNYYKGIVENSKKSKQSVKNNSDAVLLSSDSSYIELSDENDDSFNDPDWKKTPFAKRTRRKRVFNEDSSESISVTTNNETFITALTDEIISNTLLENFGEPDAKKLKNTFCRCKKDCSKKCGCKIAKKYCAPSCKCSSACINRVNKIDENKLTAINDDNDVTKIIDVPFMNEKQIEYSTDENANGSEKDNDDNKSSNSADKTSTEKENLMPKFNLPHDKTFTKITTKRNDNATNDDSDNNVRLTVRNAEMTFSTPSSKKKFFN